MRGKILARVYSVGASDFSTESFWVVYKVALIDRRKLMRCIGTMNVLSRTEAQSYRLRPLLARLYRPQR